MKKRIFLGLLFCFVTIINALAQEKVATPEEIAKFYKTKTCVVLNDYVFNNYNAKIKEAVTQNWTITEYEFISMAEFKTRCKDENYSFLLQTKVAFNDDLSASYSYLSLALGEKSGNLERMPDLCSFPLSYYDVDYEKYDYKLGAIVLFMQNHVKITKDNPDLNKNNIIQFYNKNLESMSGKTLYLLKDELAEDVNTEAEIKKYYDGKIKFVEPEDIENAIKNKEKDIVFLHKVGPPEDATYKVRCFKLIIGAADGILYYSDFHKITDKDVDGLLKSDFKKMK